jgi:DNA polymerase-3 subunit alpha
MDNSHWTQLHLHTSYSLLDGIIKRSKLIERSKELGFGAVCVTEHGNLFNIVDFYIKCKKDDIKPIIGMEAYMIPPGEEKYNDHLLLIAKNRTGYDNLLALSSLSFNDGYKGGRGRIRYEYLFQHKKGLIVSTACLAGRVHRLIDNDDMDGAIEWLIMMCDQFGEDFFIELIDNGWALQKSHNNIVYRMAMDLKIPVIATNDVHYINRDDAYIQDVALAIQTKQLVNNISSRKMSIYEAGNPVTDGYLKTLSEMRELGFPDDAYRNVGYIIDMIQDYNIKLPDHPMMPVYCKGEAEAYISTIEILEEACLSNWDKVPKDKEITYANRLSMELEVIDNLGFTDYFLIISDIINYCKYNGILTGPGRGSASGSLVVYLLGITEVDPIRFGLYFERFLNPERVSPPDIDFDVEQGRRQEVIQYIKDTYGVENVIQIGTFSRMAVKDTVRRVGKALGIELKTVHNLSKEINIDDGTKNHDMSDLLEKHPGIKTQMDALDPQWWKYSDALCNLPTGVGVHAAGLIISDRGLSEVPSCAAGSKAAGQKINMVSQFDMILLEKMGYTKFDLLGLKSLDVIHETINLINKNNKIFPDIRSIYDERYIPLDDESTYKLIGEGETTGVFQLENEGFKGLCRKLCPSTFDHIVALNALYRPGPIGSGVMDEFIERRHGRKPVIYDFDGLKQATEYTFGLVLYQEQIMAMSRDVAGYSMPDADGLRKIIGKKQVEKIEEEGKKFISRGIEYNKYSEEDVKKAWDIIVPSGRYCVTGDTKVMLADGIYKTMKELVESKYSGEVWSFDENCNFVKRKVVDWWDNGLDRMYKIKTKGGLEINCTIDHWLLTDDGRKSIADGLSVGDSLCLVNQPIDVEDTSILKDHEVIGLAHIIAEGYLRKIKNKKSEVTRKVAVFSNKEENMLEDFSSAVDLCNDTYSRVTKNTRTGLVHTLVTNSGNLVELMEYFACDVLSIDKSIPDEVFKLNNGRLAMFIGRLYSGDGDVTFGNKGARCIKYTSKSENLIDQLRWLLACRYGIQAKKRLQRGKRKPTYIDDNGNERQHKTKIKEVWVITITDRTDIFKFYENIGKYLVGHKKQILEDMCSVGIPNNGVKADLLWWDKYSEKVINKSNNRNYQRPGYAPKKYVNRITLQKWIDNELIQNKNIRFDPIESVEYIGEENSYCITVDKEHSMLVEQALLSYQSWNLAHAVAYGYVTYVMAYLKAHFPAEFYTASLNTSLGDSDRVFTLIRDARESGITIRQPSINVSGRYFTSNMGEIIYGLQSIKGIGESVADAIISNRQQFGPFEGLIDFIKRVPSKTVTILHKKTLIIAGAFDGSDPDFNFSRAALFDAVGKFSDKRKGRKLARSTVEKGLKNCEASGDILMAQEYIDALDRGSNDKGKYTVYDSVDDLVIEQIPEWDDMTIYKHEMDTLGLSLSIKISSMFEESIRWFNIEDVYNIEEAKTKPYGWKVSIAGVITRVHEIVAKNGKKMGFIEISDDKGRADVTIFSDQWALYDFKNGQSYIMQCRVDTNKDKTEMQLIADKVISIDTVKVSFIRLDKIKYGIDRLKELGRYNHFEVVGSNSIIPMKGARYFMLTHHISRFLDIFTDYSWKAEII